MFAAHYFTNASEQSDRLPETTGIIIPGARYGEDYDTL